jgi:hypothetical protein
VVVADRVVEDRVLADRLVGVSVVGLRAAGGTSRHPDPVGMPADARAD